MNGNKIDINPRFGDLPEIISKNNGIPITSLDWDYIKERTRILFDEITSNKQASFPESLYTDIALGLVLELGVAKIIGGTYNDKEFDCTDPETFAWDILGPRGQKIEVKRKNKNFKCLNLNFKNEDYEGKYSFYDTFYKYCDRLDYLVVADIAAERVQIEYIIFAKHFRNYIQASNKIAGGSSHFFKDIPAENNGDLIRFSPKSIS